MNYELFGLPYEYVAVLYATPFYLIVESVTYMNKNSIMQILI